MLFNDYVVLLLHFMLHEHLGALRRDIGDLGGNSTLQVFLILLALGICITGGQLPAVLGRWHLIHV